MKAVVLKMILCCGMLFYQQTTLGQSLENRTLTPADYAKWSKLTQENLSPNGEWISYKLEYDSGKDTLFVKNTSTSKQYFFSKANNANFSDDDHWLTVKQKKGIILQNLKTGELKNIDSAVKADFLSEEKYLLIQLQISGNKDLVIFNLSDGTHIKIQNVKEYVISPDRKSVGYIAQNNAIQLFWISNNIKSKTLMESTKEIRKNLVWNNANNALTFLEEISIRESIDKNHKIYFLKNVQKNEEVYYLNPMKQRSIAKGKTILYKPPFTPLLISPDNKRVFFYIKGDDKLSEVVNGVEVWNSLDKLEYQRNILEGNPENRPKLVVWWPESHKISQITNTEHPSVFLTPDKKKAIVFDPHQYEPQDEIMGNSNFWLLDIETGKNKIILENQSRKIGYMGVSPDSRYLNYYKDKNWWVFDFDSGKHTLLTAELTDLQNPDTYPGIELFPYGFAGWSSNSQYIIIYTRYDTWLVSADGKSHERITDGQNSGMRYRLCTNLTANLQVFKHYDLLTTNFDLSKGLILKGVNINDKANGYYKWSNRGKLTTMVFKNSKLDRVQKASLKNAYILNEQKTDMSPQIVFFDNLVKGKVLVETNTHQKKFKWPKSKLITYKNSEGRILQGILYYPAGYHSGKKYPMIVYIYEDQSHLLHHYYNPTFYSPDGFSPNNYTTDGYFVLYPDIVYKEGKPGFSALDCVESAINNVLDKNIVDENRIGLIGHSFGGYEVSFIITQSKLFAAAVAGAAVTDFVGNSLSIDTAGRSQMWWYQTHQLRMGKPLYEDYKGYIENSPITYAQNISTPLLSWTGKNDYQVNPRQSMELHMAMRNLKKRNILLIYPDELHDLMHPVSQKDLSIKIKSWFDHYLKDAPLTDDLR